MVAALVTGLGIGALIAAQVGPVWLLCARSALRHGVVAGIAIGAGAATIDLVYAGLGALGASRLVGLPWLRPLLAGAGATVLVVLGARTIWTAVRVRVGAEDDGEVAGPKAAYLTALVATASNPLTIASWAAVFAAASVGEVTVGTLPTLAFLAGVAAGSLAWFTTLAGVLGLVGRRLGDRTLRAVDVFSGVGLLAFGGLLGWRALRTE